MKLLFSIDTKDYDLNSKTTVRPSSRSIIIKDKEIAMVHSKRYDYYKFPGGGINEGETKEHAVIRETLEEAGLNVIPSSIKEFGYVHRIQKGRDGGVYIQDNYYYFCDVESKVNSQNLDDYEDFEQFTLEYVDPIKAMKINRSKTHGPKDPNMIEREAHVLEILIDEGYFN